MSDLADVMKLVDKHVPRPRGRPSNTSELRKMIVGALHMAGGVDYLHRQAERNPVAFMGLLGKILPSELRVEADGKGDGPVVISVSWLDQGRLGYQDEEPLEVLARPVEGFEDLGAVPDSPEAASPGNRLGADELW